MERASHSGSPRLNRRQLAIGAILAGATLTLPRIGPAAVAKQGDLASAGYPTIDVTVTASGFEGLPETLEAGRYLVNVTAADDVGFYGFLGFVKPFEMSAADFVGFLGAMTGPPPEASPEAAPESPPEGEEGGEMFLVPPFIYQSAFAGGAGAPAGGTGLAVIDLTEGEWVAWGDDPMATQVPAIVTVTGEFPAEVVDPEAAVTITMVDFGIMVDGPLTVGEHIVKIDNQGAQPHFVDFEMLPSGTTNEQIAAMLAAPPPDPSATPEAGALNPETDFVPVAISVTQSIDVQTWMTITLEAGTLGMFCWFPTAGVGDPHAFHGMHAVTEVTG